MRTADGSAETSGAWRRSLRCDPERSHVENGAVKGDSASAISSSAALRRNMCCGEARRTPSNPSKRPREHERRASVDMTLASACLVNATFLFSSEKLRFANSPRFVFLRSKWRVLVIAIAGVQFAMQRGVFSKICATLLIALTISPVTAPFSTCDLATLIGRASPGQLPRSHAPAPDDRSSARAPVPVAARLAVRSRLRFVAVADHCVGLFSGHVPTTTRPSAPRVSNVSHPATPPPVLRV